MCDSCFLDWAPCPPFFVDEVYVVYITFATKQNLSECEIETIRDKCGIEIPTTTTTTTTTPSTTTPTKPTTTTTLPWPNTPETANTTTTQNTTFWAPTSGTDIDNTTSSNTSDITTSSSKSGILTNESSTSGSTITSTSVVTSTNDSSLSNLTTFQPSSTPIVDRNVTINNSTDVPVGAASSGEAFCQGVCLIVVSTTVACIAIVLLAVVAVLLRKVRDDGKRARDRSRSRSRSRNRYSEVPNTELYDSVDLPSYSNRSSGSEMWQDSSDYSLRSVLRKDPSDTSIKEHTFVNPAFRRSFEPPSRASVYWYDPDAADPVHLHRNANLTRFSRTLDRKSPPKTVLNNQKEASKFRARSRSANHVSLRDYVPKAVQYVDNLEQLPYHACNGNVRNDVRGKSPSKRSLPRTPIEVRPTLNQEPVSPQQRPSYRRSRSYDLDAPKPPTLRDEDGFYTVDTRHSRKHYIKNSHRNKLNGQAVRDRSVKGKLHRQIDGDTDEVFLSPDPTLGQLQRLSNHSLNSPDHRVLSSNLRPGSYKFRSQQAFFTDNDSDCVESRCNKRGRSRSHRELREPSPSLHVRRGRDLGSNFRPLPTDQIYVFQTKL